MMRENQRQRVWPLTWTWVIPSSSCMKLCAVPGTARASWFLSLSCSYRPGKTTQTTTTRLVSPSAFIRSSMTELCFHSAVFMLLNLLFFFFFGKIICSSQFKEIKKENFIFLYWQISARFVPHLFFNVFINDLFYFFFSPASCLFYLMWENVASNTLTVQFSFPVPSFPNVRAHNSPQEQDEKQRVWECWAHRLRSDIDVWECQALQRSSLFHLQACSKTSAYSAGQCLPVPCSCASMLDLLGHSL